MTPPLATIIVPLLRQPDDWLDVCVRSAVVQSVPVEVIVVTAVETPPSNRAVLRTICSEYSHLRLLARPEGSGFAGALNSGIEAAVADRVGFLLADDWLDATVVEKCLARSADIVSTQVANYEADGKTPLGIERRINMSGYEGLETDQARASYLSHFYLFRRNVLLEVGGVDPAIGQTGADDYDLIWTLLEHGATVDIVEEVLYFKRDHDGERLTLRDREAQVADLEKIFDKHGVHGELRDQLITRHARWFGRPIHEVVREDESRS